jgi:hypothetical protein
MRWTTSRTLAKNLLLGGLLAALGVSSACGLSPEPEQCGEGEVAEGDACIEVACSAARWEELQEQGRVVAPGGTGDGSPDAPFGSLAEALAVHPVGPLILSAGTYSETVSLDATNDGLVVHGHCSSLVTIDGSSDDSNPVLLVDAGGDAATVHWTGTTFSGGRADGIRIFGGARLEGADIEILASTHSGLQVRGASAAVEGLVISDVALGFEEAGGGTGVYCLENGEVELSDVSISRAERQGVLTSDCDVVFQGITVLDTEPDDSEAGDEARGDSGGVGSTQVEDGIGIATIGGSLQGADVRVERARTFGIALFGTEGSLDNVAVYETRPRAEDDELGTGLALVSGASLSGSNYELLRNHRTGLLVAGASADLSGVTVTDTQPELSSARYGRGVEVGSGGDLTVSDLYIADCYDLGLVVDEAQAVVDGARIERILPRQENGRWGRGIEVLRGGHLVGSNLEIVDNLTDGIALHESSAVLTDVLVSGTRAEEVSQTTGRGIGLLDGSSLIASGLTIHDNQMNGIQVARWSHMELQDATISDTIPDPLTGDGTTGIEFIEGSTGSLSNVVLRDNHQVGVMVVRSEISLQDITVEGTLPRPATGDHGRGVDVLQDSIVSADGLVLRENHELGLRVVDSTFTGTDIAVRDIIPTGVWSNTGANGWGVLFETSSVDVSELVVEESHGTGVMVRGGDAVLQSSSIDGVWKDHPDGKGGTGLEVSNGGTLLAEALSVTNTWGPGLVVPAGTAMTCTECDVSQSRFASVALKGFLELNGGSISDSLTHRPYGGGVGLFVKGGELVANGVSVFGHTRAGVWLEGPGSYDLAGSSLEGNESDFPMGKGHAVVARGGVTAWDNGQGLRLAGNTIANAGSAAVLLYESTGSLEGNSWSGNQLDLQQIQCDGIDPVDTSNEPALILDVCPANSGLLNPLHGEWAQ